MAFPIPDEMTAAISADAAADRLARWGRSTVVDELAGAPVLPPEAVRALHATAGLDSDGVVGNAGVVHVYGYLLSTATTPFGPKRARWTGGGVARALGLPVAALLPGGAATPLETLTPILEAMLGEPPAGAIVVDEGEAPLAARTVLLPGLAIHGTAVGGPMRPITVFPISDAAAALAAIEAEAPRLRYNAVDAAGRAGTPLGVRRIRRAA